MWEGLHPPLLERSHLESKQPVGAETSLRLRASNQTGASTPQPQRVEFSQQLEWGRRFAPRASRKEVCLYATIQDPARPPCALAELWGNKWCCWKLLSLWKCYGSDGKLYYLTLKHSLGEICLQKENWRSMTGQSQQKFEGTPIIKLQCSLTYLNSSQNHVSGNQELILFPSTYVSSHRLCH